MSPLLAAITLTFPTLLVLIGIICLLLAALNVPGFTRWNWLAGGIFLLAVAYLVSVSG